MGGSRDGRTAAEISMVGLGLGLLLLVTPARFLWARAEAGWLAPFVVWIVLIGLAAWASHSATREDE
ncbi:hypothetical protein [Chondromyces crocatus]|uniref:Uncharacterized protein n=1 Tax=Chondromyces crocatus TaxID=52 RepID=A0A0K1E7I5_CHOCO|nr:hypothetical protein [Chondromyces crocatus]AKT36825.1 uncharacterized protein CMC5_009460 [Chondromyces crocatus]